MTKKQKMNTKNLPVFFFALASVLLLVGSLAPVSATGEIANINAVKVNDIPVTSAVPSLVAGESVTVQVFFTAVEDASDATLEVEIEGDGFDVEAETNHFTMEDGHTYVKTLVLTVPHELQDEVSEELTLNIEISNGDYKTEESIALGVQRPSYDIGIMSISSPQNVVAGELVPFDVVLKNIGYEKLDDLTATIKIPALGVESTHYFGDLVPIEDGDDYEDTVAKRFFVQIPYGAEAGLYAVEVEAKNSDVVVSSTKQISVSNEFASNVLVASTQKTVAVGEDAEFNLIVANPTNKLKVFRIVTESTSDLTTGVSSQLITVPAGMSKTVVVNANAQTEGTFNFKVGVLSGESLLNELDLSVVASGKAETKGPVVALTIILVIVLLVLLGVLMALLRKKPGQSEEFGESYY